MLEDNEIKRLVNRHIWSSIAVNAIAMILVVIGVSLMFPQKQAEYLSASVIAVTFGLIETMVLMKIWLRVVLKTPDSLPTFYTASSGFRMLAALAMLLVVYIFVGRDAMLPYFLVFVLSYFLVLILHSLFFKKMTERLL